MKSVMLKDIPPELHGRLKQAAQANFRSLTQEALARLDQSFRLDELFNARQVAAWIDEALASGPEEPLSYGKFKAAFQRGLQRLETRRAPH